MNTVAVISASGKKLMPTTSYRRFSCRSQKRERGGSQFVRRLEFRSDYNWLEKMILGMWNDIKLVCGCHDMNSRWVEAQIQMKGLSPFYACPKYYPENREPGERSCGNRLSTYEFERMIKHLADKIEKDGFGLDNVNLQNYSWVSNKVQFRVVSQKGKTLVVSFVNKRVLY